MLRIGEQLGVAVVVGLTISCLLTAMLSARRTRMSSNGFASTRIAMKVPDW
jgi:hypothetical protein